MKKSAIDHVQKAPLALLKKRHWPCSKSAIDPAKKRHGTINIRKAAESCFGIESIYIIHRVIQYFRFTKNNPCAYTCQYQI